MPHKNPMINLWGSKKLLFFKTNSEEYSNIFVHLKFHKGKMNDKSRFFEYSPLSQQPIDYENHLKELKISCKLHEGWR